MSDDSTIFSNIAVPLVILAIVMSIVIGFSIYFIISIRKAKKKYEESIEKSKENDDIFNSIKKTYTDKFGQFNSNLITYSNNYINLQSNIKSNIDNINQGISKGVSTSNVYINNDLIITSSNNNIALNSKTPLSFNSLQAQDMFFSDYLKVGTFTIRDSNGQINMTSTNPLNKVITSEILSSNINTKTIGVSGKLNFANVNFPTTLDVSPEGDLRLIMEHGSNGISPFRSFNIMNKYGKALHEFDINGNARSSNVILGGDCINFKDSNNTICYKSGQGIIFNSANSNNVTNITDTLNADTLNTKSINLGGLVLTSSNGILSVYQDNKMIGNVSYVK